MDYNPATVDNSQEYNLTDISTADLLQLIGELEVRLRLQANTLEQQKKSYLELGKEVSKLKSANESLEKSKSECTATQQELERCKVQVNRLQGTIDSLTNELNGLRNERTNLEERLRQMQASQSAYTAELENQVRILTAENKELLKKINDLEKLAVKKDAKFSKGKARVSN